MTKHKKIILLLSGVLVLLIGITVFLWAEFGTRAQLYSCTNYAMKTYVQQSVYGKSAKSAAAAAADRIGTLENLITLQSEDSDTSHLNAAAGTVWTSIDPKTAKLLRTVLAVAASSDGAYDPTILPVSALWDFGGDNQRVPSQSDIAKYLPYVNYRNLRVSSSEDSASLRDHYMVLTLDAVGRGAACDEAAAAYKASGAEGGVVSVGTSVGIYGKKPGSSNWSIAVRDPAATGQNAPALGELSLLSGFVSTVSTSQNSFRKDGVLYFPLLNPKTGYPQNNGLLSVTVVSPEGALSDALANACFVLGREKSADLLQKYKAQAIFVDSARRVFLTPGLKKEFTVTGKYSLQP